MRIEDEIYRRLSDHFHPSELQVINESHHHAGHAGHDGSGESHYRVVLRAPALADMSRVARHRAVHGALGADLIGRIHALALEVSG